MEICHSKHCNWTNPTGGISKKILISKRKVAMFIWTDEKLYPLSEYISFPSVTSSVEPNSLPSACTIYSANSGHYLIKTVLHRRAWAPLFCGKVYWFSLLVSDIIWERDCSCSLWRSSFQEVIIASPIFIFYFSNHKLPLKKQNNRLSANFKIEYFAQDQANRLSRYSWRRRRKFCASNYKKKKMKV